MRVVVITGGSGGIGAALARKVATLPEHRVTVVARRETELNAVVSECGGTDVAQAVVCDVTNKEEVEKAFSAALSRWGQVDVWVNNAGRGLWTPTSELTVDQLNDMMAVNVHSALFGMQAVLPHFKERKVGQIINVSSVLGRHAAIAHLRSAYNGAKHFLNALTDSIREELRTEQQYANVVVTTISPGMVATEFGVNANSFDSRKVDAAQDVDEVAAVILSAMEGRQTEYYTRPEHKTLIDDFIEAKGRDQQFPFPTTTPLSA